MSDGELSRPSAFTVMNRLGVRNLSRAIGLDVIKSPYEVAKEFELPNEDGSHRINFSLDSGPHGIHYIVIGFLDINVTNPRRTIILDYKKIRQSAFTVVNGGSKLRNAQLPGWKNHAFVLGPDGVIAHRLTRDRRSPGPKWALIPTCGVDAAATIIAHTDDNAIIVTITDGIVF